MNYDCTSHPILLFITLLQSLFRNILLKGHLIHRWWIVISFSSVDSEQRIKNSTSNISSFPRGGAWLFRGGAKRFQGRCPPPLKIRPWFKHVAIRFAEILTNIKISYKYSIFKLGWLNSILYPVVVVRSVIKPGSHLSQLWWASHVRCCDWIYLVCKSIVWSRHIHTARTLRSHYTGAK
jgi:hypothetical protein